MYAMDVLRLTGDPSYRFDIGILPDHVNMLYDNYDALRRQVLENNLRNIKHAGKGTLMAYYKDKEYIERCDTYDWWDKLPDFRIQVDAHVVEASQPRVELPERVWEAMKVCGIAPNKKEYTPSELTSLADNLNMDSHLYGLPGIFKSQNSHAHVLHFIRLACEKYAPLPI